MKDDFLYQLREQPRVEFVQNLQHRLAQGQTDAERKPIVDVRAVLSSRELVQGSAILALLMIAVMAFSPARAFVASVITEIAGQLFEVTEDYPGDNQPGEEEVIIEPQLMPLADALAMFPYSIQLPSEIPAGYLLDDENVRVYMGDDAGPFANTIEVEWIAEDPQVGSKLVLRITDTMDELGEIVAPDSIDEIELDDNHQGVLIMGGWDYDKKEWNYTDIGLRLRWSLDGLTYDLRGVSREQLIDIASSTLP